MRFEPTQLPGVWVLHPEPIDDARGSFARTFSADEFRAHGIDARVEQCSTSFNPQRWTLRGLHLQVEPHGETKLVRCTAGEVFDVAVDVRAASATFGQHHHEVLTARNRRSMVLPPGVAHGFMTLTSDAEVSYQMSTGYEPEAATGVRWDDPAIGIAWPSAAPLVSDKDQALPSLEHWSRT